MNTDKTENQTSEGWAIIGKHGFYIGWWLTRKDAIEAHCEAFQDVWAHRKKKGDRAVKITISLRK